MRVIKWCEKGVWQLREYDHSRKVRERGVRLGNESLTWRRIRLCINFPHHVQKEYHCFCRKSSNRDEAPGSSKREIQNYK
jgi:hypothetical protein